AGAAQRRHRARPLVERAVDLDRSGSPARGDLRAAAAEGERGAEERAGDGEFATTAATHGAWRGERVAHRDPPAGHPAIVWDASAAKRRCEGARRPGAARGWRDAGPAPIDQRRR